MEIKSLLLTLERTTDPTARRILKAKLARLTHTASEKAIASLTEELSR